MIAAEVDYRAGAVVLPSPSKDSRDIAMQIASLRYYWALAHQDPTSGVQVGGLMPAVDIRADLK